MASPLSDGSSCKREENASCASAITRVRKNITAMPMYTLFMRESFMRSEDTRPKNRFTFCISSTSKHPDERGLKVAALGGEL